jgi:acetyl-CoA acetyltransferase
MTAPTPSKMDTIALALRDALATALADDLQRSKSSRDFARRGLASLCVGVGQGLATLFEGA